jgi:hypothetical protein
MRIQEKQMFITADEGGLRSSAEISFSGEAREGITIYVNKE